MTLPTQPPSPPFPQPPATERFKGICLNNALWILCWRAWPENFNPGVPGGNSVLGQAGPGNQDRA